jgi:hypothetical protein
VLALRPLCGASPLQCVSALQCALLSASVIRLLLAWLRDPARSFALDWHSFMSYAPVCCMLRMQQARAPQGAETLDVDWDDDDGADSGSPAAGANDSDDF